MRVRTSPRSNKWKTVCDVCDPWNENVMVKVESRAFSVHLCWDHAIERLAGLNLELHHSVMSDHLDDKKKANQEKEAIENAKVYAEWADSGANS